jgi:hypothetical protein
MLARSSKASWAALDPVSALLIELRVQGTFFCNSDIATQWVMEVPKRDFASFHFVVSGDCWLALPNQKPLALAVGQLALVVRSPEHRLGSQRNLRGKLVDFRAERRLTEAASSLRQGEGDSRTHLICGGLRFGWLRREHTRLAFTRCDRDRSAQHRLRIEARAPGDD